MIVREIMTRNPSCCTPENSLVEAARLMKDIDCGAIPVVENQTRLKPVGIITDRDIVIRALASGKDPMGTKVGECMTRSLITVHADDDVEDCVHLMEDHQLRRILVVNDKGSVVGIVVQAQVALSVEKSLAGEMIEDISQPTRLR